MDLMILKNHLQMAKNAKLRDLLSRYHALEEKAKSVTIQSFAETL